MSWSDSFGPEGQKRQPLDPAKKALISNCESIFLSHEAADEATR